MSRVQTDHLRQGRFIRLRPVTEHDRAFLFRMLSDGDIGARWRLRGAVPRPQAFDQLLWDGVLTQLIVEGSSGGPQRGLVTAYAANLSTGTAHVAVALAPQSTQRGYGPEATAIFARYLFATWTLRKLYFETPEFNCSQFASAIGRYLHIEARLKGHEYFNGRYWDSLILAMYRDDLDRFYADHPRLTHNNNGNRAVQERSYLHAGGTWPGNASVAAESAGDR